MKSDEVELELRERVLRQELEPGSRLREEKLAAEFGATRSAVRSALIALEARNLVERVPNVGAVVARMDPARLLEIYDVLELLEGLAARLAAQRAAREDWSELEALFAAGVLDEAVANGDLETFSAAIETYRSTTIRLAGHAFLTEMLAGIHDQAHVLRQRILTTPGRMEECLAEHGMVIGALVRGDAEGAEQLKRHNVQSARQRLVRYRDFLV